MKSRWSIPALSAFFVAIAIFVAGCGSSSSSSSSNSIPTGAVADVAGNPISTQAFKHWFFIDAKGQQAPVIPSDPPKFTQCIADAKAAIPSLKTASSATLQSDCKMLFTTISGQVMDFLIKAYWYQAEAHKLGVNVTTQQVAAVLAKEKKAQFKTAAQFQAFLKSTGQTQADITYQTLVRQVLQKLLAKQNTKVTPAAISAYYNAHKSAFGTPEQRSMRIVLAKSASQANAALKALKGGQSWKVVAKKYSTDPTTKNNGGLLKNVSAGQQDAALSKAAFSAPKGKLEGPVKGQFGFYVLQVIGITPANQKSLTQSSAQIKQTLTSQKQTAAQTAVNNLVKKDYGAQTLCAPLYSMADCKGYKAPATSTTPAAPGATTPGATTPGATAPATPAPTTPSSGGTATTPPATAPPASSSTTTSSSSK
jgi:foldase protein PrsA